MGYKALDIANLYISLANSLENEQIDNLKLNKLCYYAQAWSLVRLGRPLFDDVIEAWKYGPVIPEVYHTFSVCGSRPIAGPSEVFDESRLTSEELSLLTDVYMTYGKYTSRALIDKTHEAQGPWAQVYVEGSNNPIPNKLIKKCFANNDELESMQLNLTSENVVTYA